MPWQWRPGATAPRLPPDTARPGPAARNPSPSSPPAPPRRRGRRAPYPRGRAACRPPRPGRRARSRPTGAPPRMRRTGPGRAPRRRRPPAWPRPRRHRSRSGTGRRRASLDRARLALGELLLVLRAHGLQPLPPPPRLVLVDLRDREADVDEDPVAGHDFLVAVEQADVDRSANPGDVDLGEPVLLVADLHDASWDGQAHLAGRPPAVGSLGTRGRPDCLGTVSVRRVPLQLLRRGADPRTDRSVPMMARRRSTQFTAGPAGAGSGRSAPQTRSDAARISAPRSDLPRANATRPAGAAPKRRAPWLSDRSRGEPC